MSEPSDINSKLWNGRSTPSVSILVQDRWTWIMKEQLGGLKRVYEKPELVQSHYDPNCFEILNIAKSSTMSLFGRLKFSLTLLKLI